jgi:hypothetical protein
MATERLACKYPVENTIPFAIVFAVRVVLAEQSIAVQ